MHNPPEQTHTAHLNPYFIYAVPFFAFVFILFSYLAFSLQIPPSKLLETILYSTFRPHFNICQTGYIDKINILGLYNFFLVLIIAILIFVARAKNQKNATPLIIRTTVILGISLFAVIQQFGRNDYFQKEKFAFGRKTISEKYTLLYGSVYTFAEQCQLNLIGKHQAKLISDQDLTKDPYSTLYRFLSYHLYPTASVRFKNDAPEDALLLFFKNDPLQSIPESYQPLITGTTGEYILAVEKKYE